VALKRDASIELGPRNTGATSPVEGVPLTHLVGRRFWLGNVLEATRLSSLADTSRRSPARRFSIR